MGLTNQSTGGMLLSDDLKVTKSNPEDIVIALAGNPNVGKSTVFNALTGLNQHTGNWPGKTVSNASGTYSFHETNHIIVDLPGTYSLLSSSVEEEVARDFICFGEPDVTVVVTDATCLERNLNLVLQTMEITQNVIVCVNLLDEAKRKKITIDLGKLSAVLGVPVVGTSARDGKGLDDLMQQIYELARSKEARNPLQVEYGPVIESAVSSLEPAVETHTGGRLRSRWIALKLLDFDQTLADSIEKYLKVDCMKDEQIAEKLAYSRRVFETSGIDPDHLKDKIAGELIAAAEQIGKSCVRFGNENYNKLDRKLDQVLTSKRFGIPIMIVLLLFIFWLTITGANYPSQALSSLLFWVQDRLTDFFHWFGSPEWLHGLLVLGVYRTLAWVVSVMLPPMAIFFPLFTLLEDLGYLPRIAFNLDNFFKKSNACGKQALTMCMGFGCNAAGVVGCRIIDSPRERLIAIITNNFVPCNGRFPTLIAIISMFFTGMFVLPLQSFMSTVILTSVIILGVLMTLFVSKLLSKTILKGIPSSFTLELPPYRKPQVGKIIIRSILDRTLFVLGRAVVVAIPAGAIIWILANITVGDASLLMHCANFLDPFAQLIGLDGVILLAFILGFPANEIVIPIIIMSYMATGHMIEFDNLSTLRQLLVDNGWTWLTAVCTMLFSLMHFPCATTCQTIRKETRSLKWTLVSFAVPTAFGILICFAVATVARLFGLV